MKRAYSSEVMSTFHIMIAKGSQKGFEEFLFQLAGDAELCNRKRRCVSELFCYSKYNFNFVRKFNINKVSLNLCLLK